MEETSDGCEWLISNDEYNALISTLFEPQCEFTEQQYELLRSYHQSKLATLEMAGNLLPGDPNNSYQVWEMSFLELIAFQKARDHAQGQSVSSTELPNTPPSIDQIPQSPSKSLITAHQAIVAPQKSVSPLVSEQEATDLKVKILLSFDFDQQNPNHRWIFLWAEEQTISTFTELLAIALTQRVRSFLHQVAIEDLDNYLASTDLAKIIFDLDTKSKIVQRAINNGLKNYFLTEGPLPKNPQTQQIEDILNRMATSDPKDFTVVFKPRGAYELTIDTKVIDLSLILKHADLSQLQLSDDTVLVLVTMISKLISFPKMPLGDEVLSRLTQSHRQCICYHTLNFEDVNKFFRGEKITSPNFWQYFILGCVVTDAVNRLPSLLDNYNVFKDEKAVLHKIEIQALSDFRNSSALPMPFLSDIKTEVHYNTLLERARAGKIISQEEFSILQGQYQRLLPLFGYNSFIRRENLTPDDAARRVAKDSCTTSSLTSTSYNRDVFDKFSYRVVFEPFRTVGISSVSRFSYENEVLLPPGLRVRYVFSGDGNQNLVATIRRSPADYNAYWPEHALSYALEHHLNKKYKDRPDTREIGGITVHRPNHGLPHNYRMMAVLPLLVLHFSNHAVEQTFRNNCRTLTHETLNWLQIAAVFCITGRESEASYSENPERYMNYREACAQHFLVYVQTANPVPGDLEQRSSMIERLQEIIHFMGNPNYESQINQYPDPEERALRNHLHRLLSLAHEMDLPRCYSHGQYTESLAKYHNMVIKSAGETSDWYTIQHYLSSLNEAQGDSCCFSINPDGSVANMHRSYQPHFGQISTSLSAITAVSELVSPPVIRPRLISVPSTLGIFSKSQELQPVTRIHACINSGH